MAMAFVVAQMDQPVCVAQTWELKVVAPLAVAQACYMRQPEQAPATTRSLVKP